VLFADGANVVLYTDGLVERRDGRLAAAMAPVAAPDDVTRAWLALDTTGLAHVGFALAEPELSAPR